MQLLWYVSSWGYPHVVSLVLSGWLVLYLYVCKRVHENSGGPDQGTMANAHIHIHVIIYIQ